MGNIVAPLGSRRGRYAPRLEALTAAARAALEEYFTLHPDAYVALSGGKDSTVCLALAREVNPEVRAAFFNSGLEFPQTLRYIERLQQKWGFDLHEFHAQPSALEVMVATGTWEHGAPKNYRDDMHAACIERPLAEAQKVLGRASVYGLRADESPGRTAMLSQARGWVTKHASDGTVEQEYLAPIWRWSFDEVHAFLGGRGIPLNPVYRELMKRGVPERRARVGLLVDGWALDQGRWALARAIAPDLARVVETHLPALAEFR